MSSLLFLSNYYHSVLVLNYVPIRKTTKKKLWGQINSLSLTCTRTRRSLLHAILQSKYQLKVLLSKWKKALLVSHLPLARSLNLWHVLAGTVNKLKLPLQANPALYMSSQLWICHLFLLYGIFKSIEKVFYPVSFLLSFLSVLFFGRKPIVRSFEPFWPWKKKAERNEGDTLTGFPFVRLMVRRRRRREGVEGEGAGYRDGSFGGGGRCFQKLPPHQVFVAHLCGEELDKILLLMTKHFEWGSANCGKIPPSITNLKQQGVKDWAKGNWKGDFSAFLLLSSFLFLLSSL